MGALEALRYRQGPPASLQILNQRRLPFEEVFEECSDCQAAWTAIKVLYWKNFCSCMQFSRALASQAVLVCRIDWLHCAQRSKVFSSCMLFSHVL